MSQIADYEVADCVACEDFVLPEGAFEDCDIQQDESEIWAWLIGLEDPDNAGHPVGGDLVFTEAGIAARIGVDIQMIVGVGSWPKSEKASRTVSIRREISGPKTFSLPFAVDDTRDENYEQMRAFECQPTVRAWPVTLGAKIYGGPTGIKCKVQEADLVGDSGDGNFERFEYMFKWRSPGHPPRNEWPLPISGSAPTVEG